MYLLYSLLLTFGVVALLPRFIYDALRHGKYVAGLGERLGRLPAIEANGRAVIWLHCVSVGEVQAARPLARALLDGFPSHSLVVSTTTLTGQSVARDVFSDDAAAVIYFPFDWAWTVRRSLRKINPSAVLIMETELWPNFLRQCKKRDVPTAIISGRLSERSFRRYQLIGRFLRRVVNDVDVALMQTESDARRISALGLDSRRAFVSGNIKFDLGDDVGERELSASLGDRFNLSLEQPLIVAASTHVPEERIVLEAFHRLRATSGNGNLRLLIAPRHPERFEEVAGLLASSTFAWARRSDPSGESDRHCDVILLDSIGELRAVYPFAKIVFLGGSIASTGGHNVLEPAAAGACTVTGAHTFNFKAVIKEFLEADALVQLPPLSEKEASSALVRVLQELLANKERRDTLSANAHAVLDRNRGATSRTIKLLSPILSGTLPSERNQTDSARRGALSA